MMMNVQNPTAAPSRAAVTGAAATSDGLLRFALKADAGITAANGLAYLAGFALLDGWLGVPATFLAGVGAFLLVFATFVGYVGTREQISRVAAGGIVAANLVWAVDSVILLLVDGFTPTLGGQIVIGVQAAGVAGLAALQYAGLRRARPDR
jgi:hypothetical protein